jgi:hypothetical protein
MDAKALKLEIENIKLDLTEMDIIMDTMNKERFRIQGKLNEMAEDYSGRQAVLRKKERDLVELEKSELTCPLQADK